MLKVRIIPLLGKDSRGIVLGIFTFWDNRNNAAYVAETLADLRKYGWL